MPNNKAQANNTYLPKSPYFYYDRLAENLNLDASKFWKLSWAEGSKNPLERITEYSKGALDRNIHSLAQFDDIRLIKIEELEPGETYDPASITQQDPLIETVIHGTRRIPTSKNDYKYELLVDKQITNDAGITLTKSFQTLDAEDVKIIKEGEEDSLLSQSSLYWQYLEAFFEALPFTSTSNDWKLEEDFNGDEVSRSALDLHFGIDQTIDYYFEQFNRNSIDNAGSTVIALHRPLEFNDQDEELSGLNAFASGSFEYDGFHFERIAFFDGITRENGKTLDISGKVFANLKTVGHELTHNVITSEGGLNYWGKSGALNEGIADILGSNIYANTYGEDDQGTPTWDWLMAIGDIDGEPDPKLSRLLSNPGVYDQPDTYGGENWHDPLGIDGDEDSGGVHINSGVLNYWYVLAVEGSGNNGYGKVHSDQLFGSHENYTNDNGYIYDVEGIGMEKMQGVVYHALTDILIDNYGERATFKDAREATIEAAEQLTNPEIANLYPGVPILNAADVDTVIAAWDAVGVNGGLEALVGDDSNNPNLTQSGWSDVRLKEDIQLIGKSQSGVNIYSFKYKHRDGMYEGVMAQEVPWARKMTVTGFYMVDYNKLDVDFKKLN